MKQERRILVFARELVHRTLVLVGAAGMGIALFLTLPLLQAITQPPEADLTVRGVDSTDLPPPPPPPPEEEKKQEVKEEQPPEPPKLMEESVPLDLSQLELALDLGTGGAEMGGDFAVKITSVVASAAQQGSSAADDLVSLADLDQEPRLTHSPQPTISDALRRKTPARIVVIFVVDSSGRVENPIVQSSTDPSFDRPALNAIKQWRFEPGKRKGQPVRFRMRQSFTFPKSN